MSSSHTKYSIETLTNRFGPSGSSLLTVAVACIVVLGIISIPIAGGQTGEIDESEMAYVDEGTVHIVDANGDTTDTDVQAQIVGPPADFDGDGTVEVPSVTEQGTLRLVEPGESTTKLADDALAQETAMALGDYDNDGTRAVIYVNSSNSIYRVEPGENEGPESIAEGAQAKGVIDYGDFDGDGNKQVVYVGTAGDIRYINDNGSIIDTSKSVGVDAGLGAGPLGDFNGDGNKRVAVVDDSSQLALVNSSGDKRLLKGNYNDVEKASIAAADVTGDSDPEVIYLNKDTEENLYYMTLDGKTQPFKDESGNDISADDGAGISGGTTTVSDSTGDDGTGGSDDGDDNQDDDQDDEDDDQDSDQDDDQDDEDDDQDSDQDDEDDEDDEDDGDDEDDDN